MQIPGCYDLRSSEISHLPLIPHDLRIQLMADPCEQSEWHSCCTVIDHTIDVYSAGKRLSDWTQGDIDIQLDLYLFQSREKIINCLDYKDSNCTSLELLLYSSLWHDVGKYSTRQIQNGCIRFPMHEVRSKELFDMNPNALGLLPELTQRDATYLGLIILYHEDMHRLIEIHLKEKSYLNVKKSQIYQEIKLVLENEPIVTADELETTIQYVINNLVLFTMIDLLGSHMCTNDPDGFDGRMKLYSRYYQNI